MLMNRRRDEFPTLASGIHLLSHSLGPVPKAARESMLAYCDAWERHTGEDAWATSWWELSQLVGDRLARILGGAEAQFRFNQMPQLVSDGSLMLRLSHCTTK